MYTLPIVKINKMHIIFTNVIINQIFYIFQYVHDNFYSPRRGQVIPMGLDGRPCSKPCIPPESIKFLQNKKIMTLKQKRLYTLLLLLCCSIFSVQNNNNIFMLLFKSGKSVLFLKTISFFF